RNHRRLTTMILRSRQISKRGLNVALRRAQTKIYPRQPTNCDRLKKRSAEPKPSSNDVVPKSRLRSEEQKRTRSAEPSKKPSDNSKSKINAALKKKSAGWPNCNRCASMRELNQIFVPHEHRN